MPSLRCDGDALWRILSGLWAEWEGSREPRLLHHWIELAHAEARRIAQPWNVDDRLWAVWDEVTHDLAAHWTLGKLAARYGASKEHFRRVCLRQLGRSPKAYRPSTATDRA